MTSRYLFRDDVLIAEDHEQQHFDDLSKQHDLMLIMYVNNTHTRWSTYRMVWFGTNWGWHPMPDSTTKHLRALLLLQKS